MLSFLFGKSNRGETAANATQVANAKKAELELYVAKEKLEKVQKNDDYRKLLNNYTNSDKIDPANEASKLRAKNIQRLKTNVLYARSNYSQKLTNLKYGVGNKAELNAAKNDYDVKYKRLYDFKKGNFVPEAEPVVKKTNSFDKPFKNVMVQRDLIYEATKNPIQVTLGAENQALLNAVNNNELEKEVGKLSSPANNANETPIVEPSKPEKYTEHVRNYHNRLERPRLRNPPPIQVQNNPKTSIKNRYVNKPFHNLKISEARKPKQNNLRRSVTSNVPGKSRRASVNTPSRMRPRNSRSNLPKFKSFSNANSLGLAPLQIPGPPLNVESRTRSLQDKLAARQQGTSQHAESPKRKLTPEQGDLALKFKTAKDALRAI